MGTKLRFTLMLESIDRQTGELIETAKQSFDVNYDCVAANNAAKFLEVFERDMNSKTERLGQFFNKFKN